MAEKKFLFLILSILGVILLSFLSQIIPPKTLVISQISNKEVNQLIQIEATIEVISEKPGFQSYLLKDKTGNLSAISFSEKNIKIKENQTYLITGRIQESIYKSNRTLQLNINKIER